MVLGQNGLHAFELYDFITFNLLLPAVAFVLLAAILLSAVPAFISGVFLAWLLHHNYSRTSVANQRKISFGALVGASAGVVLTLLILDSSGICEQDCS